ncbi:MAG: glycosyltransferase [Anaerolineales bacterium]
MAMYKRSIIYTGPFNPRLCDGISSSTIDLLVFLKSRGHEVFIISFMHDSNDIRQTLNTGIYPFKTEILSRGDNFCNFIMDGINIYSAFLPLSRDEILSCHPIVLEQYLRKIREYSNSYFFTVDIDCTCLVAHSILSTSSAHFIHSPVSSIDLFNHDAALKTILRKQTVFTVSEFSQNEILKTLNIQSRVWPPFINPAKYKYPKRNNSGRKLGYYSAGSHKGDEIVESLVEEMPDYHFVIMGYGYPPVWNAPNVTFLGPTTDLDLFYGEISALLVPSMMPEGYPRVIIEAALNGIPAIANRIGGIPEAMGHCGILIEMESHEKMVEKYKLAIQNLHDNQKKYEEYSNKAIERAEKYKMEIEQLSSDYESKFF